MGAAPRLLEESKVTANPDAEHPKCPGLTAQRPTAEKGEAVQEAGVTHLLSTASSRPAQTAALALLPGSWLLLSKSSKDAEDT